MCQKLLPFIYVTKPNCIKKVKAMNGYVTSQRVEKSMQTMMQPRAINRSAALGNWPPDTIVGPRDISFTFFIRKIQNFEKFRVFGLLSMFREKTPRKKFRVFDTAAENFEHLLPIIPMYVCM